MRPRRIPVRLAISAPGAMRCGGHRARWRGQYATARQRLPAARPRPLRGGPAATCALPISLRSASMLRSCRTTACRSRAMRSRYFSALEPPPATARERRWHRRYGPRRAAIPPQRAPPRAPCGERHRAPFACRHRRAESRSETEKAHPLRRRCSSTGIRRRTCRKSSACLFRAAGSRTRHCRSHRRTCIPIPAPPRRPRSRRGSTTQVHARTDFRHEFHSFA